MQEAGHCQHAFQGRLRWLEGKTGGDDETVKNHQTANKEREVGLDLIKNTGMLRRGCATYYLSRQELYQQNYCIVRYYKHSALLYGQWIPHVPQKDV